LDGHLHSVLQQPVTAVMTGCPLSVPPDTPVTEVLDRFSRAGVHELMVIGCNGTVEGVITSRDVIAAITPGAGTRKDHQISGLDRLLKSTAATARDLVSEESLRIPDNSTIIEALSAMEHSFASSLIVVDGNNIAVGCVDLSGILALLRKKNH